MARARARNHIRVLKVSVFKEGSVRTEPVDDVGVLAGPDHAQAARLTLERGGTGDLPELLHELHLLTPEVRELRIARLRSLPRLQQVHERVQVGDHDAE